MLEGYGASHLHHRMTNRHSCVHRAAKEGKLAPQQAAAQKKEVAKMAATMQKFLQPQRKPPSLAKPADQTGVEHRSEDHGLGDLRPSTSHRERRSRDGGAREGDEAESDEQQPHRGGMGTGDAGAAEARRLGVHSSSSDDSARAAVSDGDLWAAVLADDGHSTPRGTAVGSGAGKPGPAGLLHSPGKRDRRAAADADAAVRGALQTSRAPAVEGDSVEEVSLLESPEKRQKTPRTPAAGPRPGATAVCSLHPVDDVAVGEQPRQPARLGNHAAAAREGAAPSGQPSAANFSIRQRKVQTGSPGGGRGRGRHAAAAAGTQQIERFLQRKPVSGAAEGAPCRAQQTSGHEGAPLNAAEAVEKGTPLTGTAASAASPASVVDLTQSASPQHDIPRGSSTHAASTRGGAAVALGSPSERCSVERALEELLQSRGAQLWPSAAGRTPQTHCGRALNFATPSTGGDIVVDLATPPSSQPVLD